MARISVVDNNDRLTSGNGFTLSGYSADGNPGTINVPGTGNVSFTYSYENRVKQTTLPTRTNTFKYNADGMRVEQVSSQGTRRYVYDGATIIAKTDSSGTILTYFLPGVGFVSGTSQFYYRDNALGSNLATLNSTGAVQSLTEYDGYGIEYTVQAGTNSQFRFAGKHGYQTDADTGLDLLGARYYAPKLGRFLTQDPIGYEAGLNLYAYCGNNPLSRVDPDGKDLIDLTGSQKALVNKAISRIQDYGFVPEARYLATMLRGNRIRVQTGDDTYTKHWLFGTKMNETYAIVRGDTLYLSEGVLSETNLFLQSTLLHERIHVVQNATWGEFLRRASGWAVSGGWERDAYAIERRFLNKVLRATPPGKRFEPLRSDVQRILDIVNGG